MKKFYIFFILILSLLLSACNSDFSNVSTKNSGKLNVVTTIFPPFDFTREIANDKARISMLLKPGQDAHSFEPTPSDIKKIQSSNLFIYTGGENDDWIEKILNSMDKKPDTLKLLDIVNPLEEEIVEGMQDDAHSKNHHLNSHTEIDEHVWTSPKNAILIVEKIKEILIEKDSSNSDFYEQNYKNYVQKLKKLDDNYKNVIVNSKKRPLIFGDKFPFRYLANDYNLKYFAAFSGCSNETEASPKTISFLIDKVKQLDLPIVFYIEFSNGKIADAITNSTNAKKVLINSAHNITKQQFLQGVTYLSLMQDNLILLKEALN